MSPGKLESLRLGRLGRIDFTCREREEKSKKVNGGVSRKEGRSNPRDSVPNVPSDAEVRSIVKLPPLSEVSMSVLFDLNPKRPYGPYAGYFDKEGGFVWVDEKGVPFARRRPVFERGDRS